jgi:hypothetical protein
MEIECTILDTEYAGKSCLNPDEDNEVPFIVLPHGSDLEFQVEYSYTICNESKLNNFIFDDGIESSDIVIKGSSIHEWLNKDIFKDGSPLAPGECRTKTARRKLSASAPNNPTSMKMNGKCNGKWCGCWLFKKSTIGFSTCDAADFRISQIALPKDEKYAKFIQLYHPGCGGGVIDEPLSVGVISYRDYMISDHVHLQNMEVREDGFIVICNDASEAEQVWPDHCDLSMNGMKFIGDNGKDTFVLFRVEITEDDKEIITIYDEYGVASPDRNENDRKDQEIKKGKGVAWRTTFGDGGSWNPSEWTIIPDAVAKCSPKDTCFIHPRKLGPLDPQMR